MKTKLEAAKLVTRYGGKVLIANGKIPYVIDEIFENKDIGTMFLPNEEYMPEKKRWIGYATNITGKLIVNNGAKDAILNKESSLLPIGVVQVINDFKRGEVVSIRDENDVEFARGVVNYNSDDCKRIIGNHSKEILKVLGFKNYNAVITRDYITIL
jgi:glutamate 5-kinase